MFFTKKPEVLCTILYRFQFFIFKIKILINYYFSITGVRHVDSLEERK
jgi:hypothetical protein